MNDETNLLTWDAQLLSYWFSRNPAVFQDSVLWHREVGQAKDLSAPPHITRAMAMNVSVHINRPHLGISVADSIHEKQGLPATILSTQQQCCHYFSINTHIYYFLHLFMDQPPY
jgi:hypothetical protein